MFTSLAPALYSSMNEFVVLVVDPSLMRNSLILIGRTFRTFSTATSACFAPLAWFVHCALATRSPLKAAGPEVIVKVALTLAPGATAVAIVADGFVLPAATALHWGVGSDTLNSRAVAGAPVVFVNVTVASCDDPGENVCRPGGVAVAAAGASVSRATSYFAATTFAWTSWSVASVGNVPPAVMAPS